MKGAEKNRLAFFKMAPLGKYYNLNYLKGKDAVYPMSTVILYDLYNHSFLSEGRNQKHFGKF